MPKDKWPIFIRKYDELMSLYPQAMKETPIMCQDVIALPNGKAHYFDKNIKQYFDEFIASKTVNIDLTPAMNTVPSGTPKSWSVTGQMPQTGGGKMYSYNFMEEPSGRAYAQSIVDAGGTATLYQVPDVMPPPPPVYAPAILPPMPSSPETEPIKYKKPPPVIVAPTSTAQMIPEQIQSTIPEMAQEKAPEASGSFPWAILAIPAALFMMKK